MPQQPTVLITGGGTGGHVYPGLAIAEGLRPLARVVYVGDRRKLEARVVPQRGLPFIGLTTHPFPRGGFWSRLCFLPRLTLSVLRAMGTVLRHRPALVIGVGGYVSAPVVIAAGLLKRRIALHEQNVRPGVANLKLQRWADLVMLSYEGARPYFDKRRRIEVTGCPLNPRLLGVDRAEARRRLGLDETARVVLVVGGSGGAESLNRAVVEMLPRLLEKPWNLCVYHLTGPRYFDAVSAQVAAFGTDLSRVYRAKPYSDEIQYPYAAADLIVCRAGSATLNEITALGLPAILVPSPNVTDNHQEVNARELEAHGAAEVLLDAELNGERLYAAIERLLQDEATLARMRKRSRELGRTDAQAEIVRVLRPLLEKPSLPGELRGTPGN